jgi:hypothetical protein
MGDQKSNHEAHAGECDERKTEIWSVPKERQHRADGAPDHQCDQGTKPWSRGHAGIVCRTHGELESYPHGRPGYVIDHVVPLGLRRRRCPSNMQ